MIAKLVAVLALATLAASQAAQYPAGVHPSLCPNYPHCDNALLGLHAQSAAGHASAYGPASAYGGAPAYAPAQVYAPAGHVPAGGHQLPAGVSAHECPNYPYCTGHLGGAGVAAPPLPGFSQRQYPDGVSPHNCPNYPYCH